MSTLLSDEQVGLGPALLSDSDVGFAPMLQADADVGLVEHSEDAMHLAGNEVLRQNLERDRRGAPRMNENESGAIMDAYRLLAKAAPDKLRSQIVEETKARTQTARGILGDFRAGVFQGLTSSSAPLSSQFSPEYGAKVEQYFADLSNVDPKSAVSAVGSGVGELAKFVGLGPLAPAVMAAQGAGAQRLAIYKAREKGEQIGKDAESLETATRGIVDGVLTAMFMKAGSRAAGVVRSLIQPSVKEALAKEGLTTAKKMAWAWAVDSIKSGAIAGTQYLADVGLEHLADPSVVPTSEEAAKAAAFGIVLPSAMGAVAGVAGRLAAKPPPAEGFPPGGETPSPGETGPRGPMRSMSEEEYKAALVEAIGKAQRKPPERLQLPAQAGEPGPEPLVTPPPEAAAVRPTSLLSVDQKPALPEPKSVAVKEQDVYTTPEGHQAATPRLTYDLADQMSPARARAKGVNLTDAKGENVWVRPSGEASNADRVLAIQFSTHLVNAGRARSGMDDYSDKLYANRPGYSRPSDFWELPQWIGVVAKNLPNTDVYVVRDLDEARKFLASAKYGQIAMSVLDVNSKLAQGLIDGYQGKVAVGGYTDMTPFQGRPNLTVYEKMPDFIKDQGGIFTDGTDYRHFKGTEAQPRLQLSSGCLHKCGFCSMPRMITKTTPEGVQQQIKSFGDLNYKLVYLNDKTFGQADNYTDLAKLNLQLKRANPNFEGFIIQTTAAQMNKFTPVFLKESGIRYVELGIESYNDAILKDLHKPATEKLIDAATQKIRENGMKLIPNVIVGLPAETAETYARTQEYLRRNMDVISHINVNNLAAYAGTELTAKIGKVEPGDVDQNVTARSFHKDPALHQAAYDAFTKIGMETLDEKGAVPPAKRIPATPSAGMMEAAWRKIMKMPRSALEDWKHEPWAARALAELDAQAAAEPQPGIAEQLHQSETGAVSLTSLVGGVARAVAPIVSLVNDTAGEMAFAVSALPEGKALVLGLDWVATRVGTLDGKIENPAADAYKKLTGEDRKWLSALDADGFTNAQRIAEDSPSGRLYPPNQRIAEIMAAHRNMLDAVGLEAVRVNVQAIAPDGEVVDFRQARGGRWLRNMTPDAIMAIHQGSGPLFDAIAAAVMKFNGVTLPQAENWLKEWLGPESVRKIGQIEKLRAIKILPSVVTVNGVKMAIQETDIYRQIVDNARHQAKRIYFIERFGQNIKGQVTEIERLRAGYQKSGGRVSDFDDLLTVFEGRPYGRIFRNPRNPILRGIRILDTLVASAQTSLSVVPNLPQTMILVPAYVGVGNYFAAIAETLRHPSMTVNQLAAMGAMNRAIIDWTIRPGHGPEDVARVFSRAVSRATGLEALSQFNNAVAGAGFRRLADSWRKNGIRGGMDRATAKDLRLTSEEIAAVNAGQMTQAIYNKIVQTGIEITQFITAHPHRMSKLQNIPFLRALFAYNNYAIGTFKAVLRIARRTAEAAYKGDTEARLAAARFLVVFLTGAVGAGMTSLLLRRGVKGQPLIRPGEDIVALVKKALWEVTMLGPVQRVWDADEFSGGSTEKALVNLSPKAVAIVEVINLLRGSGRWGELPVQERAGKAVTRIAPILKAAENWWNRLQHPQGELYARVRSMASAYRPKTAETPEVPVNRYYYGVHQAILRDDPDDLKGALADFQTWAQGQGWDEATARRNLRSALSARRPVNFEVATYREFMASLPPEKRQMVQIAQANYVHAIDQLTLTPEEQAAGRGDKPALRQMVASGEISEQRALSTLKATHLTPLQKQVLMTDFTGIMRVWATASPAEKGELKKQVLEKALVAIRKTPKDQQKIKDQLQAAGVLP